MARTSPSPAAPGRYTLSSGDRPLEGYTIKRAIGRGGFGEVYYATSDSGKEVALKLITRNLEVERRGVVQCMNLKSPNLITIYDMRPNDEGDTFVIMEYVAGPSLAQVLAQHPNGLPPEDVRAWLKGLVDGVSYLHDHGIVHRDLKPANVFLEDGVVKIGDYGLSKVISQSQGLENSECIGTCHYMAPEISTGKYNKPIDIYALGVILYEMVTGHVPFEGESTQEILMRHMLDRADLSALPEPFRAIVSRALAKDPSHRPVSPFELLPAGDAPKAPAVRFLGEESRPANGITFPTAAPQEEVLRIEADAPFYIGPNTWPSRRRNRDATGRTPRGPDRSPPAAAVPPPRPAPVAPPRQVAVAPTPPPAPVPLPSGRVRVAELAGSMVMAAPLVALLTLPCGLLLVDNIDATRQVPQLATLFATALIGTWSILISTKPWEGQAGSRLVRPVSGLSLGFVMGLVALVLVVLLDPSLSRWIGPDGPNLFVYGSYFALAMSALTWWNLTGRDRPARFRLWPVLMAGAVGLGLGVALPLPRAAGLPTSMFWPLPHGLAVLVLAAIVAQLVSPSDPKSAAHARFLRKRRKPIRNLA